MLILASACRKCLSIQALAGRLLPGYSYAFSTRRPDDKEARDIKYSVTHRSRYKEILELFNTEFHRDETMTKALGVFQSDSPRIKAKDDFFINLMEENCSVMALDTSLDRVVGAALFHDYKMVYPQKDVYRAEMIRLYPKLKHIFGDHGILRRVHQNVPESALKRLAGEGRIVSGFVGVVSRECRGKGILMEMHLEGERIAVKNGFTAMICDPTGKYSRRVVEELGYELLAELDYADYTGQDGEKVFRDLVKAGHKSVAVFGRRL